MSLSNYEVGTVLATADMKRAREFYEEKLGLTPRDESEEMVGYQCGGGTGINVYLSPDHAGKTTATLAGWSVENLEQLVEELASKGVTFESYDDPPLVTNEKGVVEFEDGNKVAFFRDPDGNTHALNEGM